MEKEIVLMEVTKKIAQNQFVQKANFLAKILTAALKEQVWASILYRVANKFSENLNELFVMNCLISKFFVEIPDENQQSFEKKIKKMLFGI